MLKRAGILVGIAAVLLAGVLPGGDSCALAEAADHSCCAEPAPGPTSSCCSSMEVSDSGAEVDHQSGCDCIHSPSTPGDVIVSIAPLVQDDEASLDLNTEDRFFDITLQTRARTIEYRVRSHPPPPAHLLNCSYLI